MEHILNDSFIYYLGIPDGLVDTVCIVVLSMKTTMVNRVKGYVCDTLCM
jgi:hypothetical protein